MYFICFNLIRFHFIVIQKTVGNVEIKTKNVHFYVQRLNGFFTSDVVIPFDVAVMNEGNAFDLARGIFTALVPGIYHFQFSAVKYENIEALRIVLQVNGKNVGMAGTDKNKESWNAVSISASLRLKAGDRVNMYNEYGMIADGPPRWTHFSGWLVEEDLM